MTKAIVVLAMSWLLSPTAAQAFDAAALQRLRAGERNMRGADLTNANLDGLRLRGVDLTEANLSGATLRNARLQRVFFYRANLSRVVTSGSRLEACAFRWANLTGTDFSNTAIHGGVFNEVTFGGTRFVGAVIEETRFGVMDLQGIDLSRANMRTVYFLVNTGNPGITITRVNFSGATIVNGRFDNVTIRDSNLSNLTTRDLYAIHLRVIGSDLRSARLPSAQLGTALFDNVDLANVDLSTARFATASQFRNLRCNSSTRWPANAPPAWRAQCAGPTAQPGTTSISTPAVTLTPAQPTETTPPDSGATSPPPATSDAGAAAPPASRSLLNPSSQIEVLNPSDPAVGPLSSALQAQFRPRIQSCYTAGLRRMPTLQGQLTGEVRIDGGGRSTDFVVSRSAPNTLTGQDILGCVRSAFRGVVVPGATQAARVQVRLTFLPR